LRLQQAVGLFALPLLFAACNDDFGPGDWSAVPDTTVLYSASRPEHLRRPSAFDFVSLARVAIEGSAATGAWDFVVLEDDGGFVMVPEGALLGTTSRAGIATTTESTLEAVRTAPNDTAAFRRVPVAIQEGAVYIMRSRRTTCSFFGSGVYYAKIRALEVNAAAGTFEFEVVRNPNCNDRDLIPPDDD
jgi:hypothetical protein